MLIVPIYVNRKYIDEIHILNVEGDIDGVCKYKISTDLLGEVGYVEHDRRQGPYKLIQKATEMIYEVDTNDYGQW
jgi:hypothetical protein